MTPEEALPFIFYGLNASDIYKFKCCCATFKRVIEHQRHLQEKIDLFKVQTLAKVREYVERENRDYVFADLLGNNILYPCGTTQGIFTAINECNREQEKTVIKNTLERVGLNPHVLAKKPSEANSAVVSCIKGGQPIATLIECFTFYGIDPATWISDPAQSHTVLHYAARYNRLDIVIICVEQWGCNINALTVTRSNALHYAVHASSEVRAYLIAAGCSQRQVNIFGCIPPTSEGAAVQIPLGFQKTFNEVLSNK